MGEGCVFCSRLIAEYRQQDVLSCRLPFVSANLVDSDPEFKTANKQNLTREQKYAESIRKHVLVWKKIKELKLADEFDKNVLLAYV